MIQKRWNARLSESVPLRSPMSRCAPPSGKATLVLRSTTGLAPPALARARRPSSAPRPNRSSTSARLRSSAGSRPVHRSSAGSCRGRVPQANVGPGTCARRAGGDVDGSDPLPDRRPRSSPRPTRPCRGRVPQAMLARAHAPAGRMLPCSGGPGPVPGPRRWSVPAPYQTDHYQQLTHWCGNT